MGAVDARATLEFAESRAEAAELKRWISLATDEAPSKHVVYTSFPYPTAALQYAVSRMNDKRWAPDTVAAASAAARLAVQGLCTALGALQADVAASSKADLLSLLCTMKEAAEHGALQGVDLLPAVDQAASMLSALLFTGGQDEVNNGQMFVFDKRGRLGLPHTLLAVVQGCTAAEDLAAACYLLCAAHTGHATNGGAHSLQPVAEAVCVALGSAQGAAWLARSQCSPLPKLFFAIREHAGVERASRLLAQLLEHGTAWDATRQLACQLVMDDPSQLAACCTTMPRLQASLIGLLEKLVAEVAAGLPQRPPRPGSGCAMPVPEELLAVLPDCWLFAPIKMFLRGDAEQTFIRYDGPEAAAQSCESVIERLTSEWTACFRLKPQLAHYVRWDSLRIPVTEKRGRKKTTCMISGIQLRKVDDWYYKQLLPSFQSAKREAEQLRAVLDLVPQESQDAAGAAAGASEAEQGASRTLAAAVEVATDAVTATAAEPHADAEADADVAAEAHAEGRAAAEQAVAADGAVAMDTKAAEAQAAAVKHLCAAVPVAKGAAAVTAGHEEAMADEVELGNAATEQKAVCPFAQAEAATIQDVAAAVPACCSAVPAAAALEPEQEPAGAVALAASPSCASGSGAEEDPAALALGSAAVQAAAGLQGAATGFCPPVVPAAATSTMAAAPACTPQRTAQPRQMAASPARLATPLAAPAAQAAAELAAEEALPAQVEPAFAKPAAQWALLSPRSPATVVSHRTQPVSQHTASPKPTPGSARGTRLPIRSLPSMAKDWKAKRGTPGGTPGTRHAPGSSAAKRGPGSINRAKNAKVAVELNLRTLPHIWGWFQPDPRCLRLDFQEEQRAQGEGAADSDAACAVAHAFQSASAPVQRDLVAAVAGAAEAAGPSSKRSRRL